MTTSPIVAIPRRSVSKRTLHHAGCELFYAVRGRGEPVLFIHGVGVQGSGWRPQTDDLSSDYTCLSFDNRGMGRSQPAALAITVRQMADDVRALMDAQRWPSAHVVGHSLGGMVALQLALDRPDRVRSLSLLCSFANGRSAAPMTPRMMWLGMRSRIGTRAMRREGFLQLVLPPVADGAAPAEIVNSLPDLFGHDLGDQPAIVNAQLRAIRDTDLTPRLTRLALVPTMVVCAAHDLIAPPAAAREIAHGIPGARLVTFDDAAHGLPMTHAESVNALLRDHLEKAERRW